MIGVYVQVDEVSLPQPSHGHQRLWLVVKDGLFSQILCPVFAVWKVPKEMGFVFIFHSLFGGILALWFADYRKIETWLLDFVDYFVR